MFAKKFNSKASALVMSVIALSACPEVFAEDHCHHRHHGDRVEAAQANYQDTNTLNPVANVPIPFTVQNFENRFEVNSDQTVFQVEVSGLYSIDSFLQVNLPTIGDVVDGYITINDRQLLTFYSRETRTGVSPLVNFHFNDRLVYLRRGDRVSVVLSTFPVGTTVLSRGFVIVALNNSR